MLDFITPTAIVLAAFLCTACGGGERPPEREISRNEITTPRATADTSRASDDVATGSCESSSARDCRVWLPETNGAKNCFVGTQLCVEGSWSGCLSDDDAAELLDG